mgnify:CR=1 FL=1
MNIYKYSFFFISSARVDIFRENPIGWGFFLLYLCVWIIKLYANVWVAIRFLQKGNKFEITEHKIWEL